MLVNLRRDLGWIMLLLAGCAHAPARVASPTHDDPRRASSVTSAAPDQPASTPSAQPSTTSDRTLRPDDLKGLPWRSVGPANMGGRVAAIALAPGNAKTFFVGFGTGGLWKTTNGGTTFSPVFDKEATASIGSVVVADAPPDWPGWKDEPKEPEPSTPPGKDKEKEKGKAKIVWVGTGEGNGRNSSSYGRGVYRSTDGGGTFTNVGLPDSHDIPALAVDPRNPDVCFAAVLGHLWGPNKERGLYKTTDAGKTWTPVLQIDENTGCCDVVMEPGHPDTLYAAMYMRRRTAYSYMSGGPNGGIYRSTDAGATWKKLAGGLPAQTGRIGLDIYTKDPKVVFAVVESDEGGFGVEIMDDRKKAGGVFRSNDRGETWTRLDDRSPRAFYFSKIRVDPGDDQRVYRLGWGLDVSDDAGHHFRAGGARRPHGDLHTLAIDPADTDHLLLGTDGGIYVSWDRAATWDYLGNLAVGEFYNVAVDMSVPYRIAGGLQDNGSWIGPSATIFDVGADKPGEPGPGITNDMWRFYNDGDGFHVAFDPTDPNIAYAESQGGVLSRVHLDTGDTKLIRPGAKEGQPRFRFNWNSPFFVSPHNPTTLYLGGNYVFKLTDKGDKWEKISPDLSTRDINKVETMGSEAETHGTVVSLAESPLAAGMIWAGTDDGLIQLTGDDGKTWTNITPPEVAGRYIARIEASHHQKDTAYVAVDGHRMDDMDPHLMVTTDAGRSWRTITGDLPKGSHASVIREDLASPRVLYAGTETAAYVSIDAGEHWIRINGESLPTVAVDDIVQQPRETDLVAGTHGRSIYVLDDASPLSQLTPEVVREEFHAFAVRDARPHWTTSFGGIWGDRMFKAANPSMGARITYWIRDYTGDDVKISIENASGVAIRDLSGPAKPGLNRVVWDLQPEEYDRLPDPENRPQFVPPGEYTIRISYGKTHKAVQKVNVLAAPGR